MTLQPNAPTAGKTTAPSPYIKWARKIGPTDQSHILMTCRLRRPGLSLQAKANERRRPPEAPSRGVGWYGPAFLFRPSLPGDEPLRERGDPNGGRRPISSNMQRPIFHADLLFSASNPGPPSFGMEPRFWEAPPFWRSQSDFNMSHSEGSVVSAAYPEASQASTLMDRGTSKSRPQEDGGLSHHQ